MSLTKYPSGSLRELVTIAFPLMLSAASLTFMIFVDRLLLAKYSTAALNAATNATTLGYAILFGFMSLAGIGEVFVAQYNGAKEYKKIGTCVWQGLWISGLSSLVFFPIAIWGGDLIYSNSLTSGMENDYFSIIMLFGPIFPTLTTLSGFWIGRGKTGLITFLAIIANIVNILLDLLLIFGIEGWVNGLGIKGAAIATGIGSLLQTIILMYLFLRKQYREDFLSGSYYLNPPLLMQMIRIGLPNSIMIVVEMFGWVAFYATMTFLGETHITIAAVCQSMAILFFFFSDALMKASATVAGNLIGAKQHIHMPKLILSGIKLVTLFIVFLIIVIIPFVDFWIEKFLDVNAENFSHGFKETLTFCLFLTTAYIGFEGVRLLISGILTAAGDTLFLCFSNSVAVWGLMYIPVYFLVYRNRASIPLAFVAWVFYSSVTSIIFYLRYLAGSWKEINISPHA